MVDDVKALKNRKTLKKPKLELLDNALWTWFCQKRRKGTPLSGLIIKEKALILHKKLEVEDQFTFTASEVWLDRRQTRHDIRYLAISSQKLYADNEASKEFSLKFKEIV